VRGSFTSWTGAGAVRLSTAKAKIHVRFSGISRTLTRSTGQIPPTDAEASDRIQAVRLLRLFDPPSPRLLAAKRAGFGDFHGRQS